MATLEKIRSRSVLLVTVIAVALLAFIVGDFLNNSSSLFGGSRTKVGEVEGKELSYDVYQNQIKTMTNVFKMSGQNQMTDGDIRDAVWNTFVQSAVMENEAEEIGMSVTPEELKDNTLGENVHPMMRQIPLFYNQQNQFDKNILLNVLANMDKEGNEELKSYWLFWEERIKEQILTDKFQTLAVNAMSTPKAELDYLKKMAANDVDLVYAYKQYRLLEDSAFVPSKSDLEAKYNEIKKRYKTDGYRTMKTNVFDVTPSQTDYEQTEQKVKDAEAFLKTVSDEELPFYVSQESDVEYPYNPSYLTSNDIDFTFRDFAFSAAKDSVAPTKLDGGVYKTAKVLSSVVMRPDSAKVSRLVVAGKSKDEANATADSLMNVIKSGADFAELVQKHSADPQSRQNGGDLGWIREGQVGIDTFDNVVFSSKVNQVSKLDMGQFYLLVKVTDLTSPVKKVRFAEVANKVVAGNETFRSVYEKANSFIAENNTKEKFDAAAKEQNLLVRDLGPMTKSQSNLYVVENGRPIVRWAYDSKLNQVCNKPFDSKNSYIVGYVSEIVEEGYSPANSRMVEGQLKNEVIKDMKAEQLKAEMANLSDLSVVGRVDSVHVSFNQSGLPGVGAEPAVMAAIFTAPENTVVSPIVGEQGVYAIKVLSKTPAADTENVARRAMGEVGNIVGRTMVGVMMQDADTEDNRSRFY